MATLEQIGSIVEEILQIGGHVNRMEADTPLLGCIPEFDSMAVVSILTLIEDSFGVVVEDDEVSAEVFSTLGSLHEFVESKLA